MILKPFSAILVRSMDKEDYALPLNLEDRNRLLAQLPVGESTYLVLRDDIYTEEIEVENACGDLLVKARGLGETIPRKFPRGSAVCFDLTLTVVKYLICNHDCCAGGSCAPVPIEIIELYLPNGSANTPWSGVVIFGGSEPMELSCGNVPSWITPSVGRNYIKLEGTPTSPGSYNLSIAGTNASGLVVTSVGTILIE
ncbi:MAG: hypothetical protein LBS60_08865 [Deltaproteobacteria bacterium]|jgi:hypothetical protein|nr:hypothetical protein [Deltaproteobacteria bacterium]